MKQKPGSVVRVGGGQRVTGRAKAGSTVRVGVGRRVVSEMGIGGMINTNPVDQEFGRHSVNERHPIGPRGAPHRRTYGAPGIWHLQMTCPNS